MNEKLLDREIRLLVLKYGMPSVLAALCRECNNIGRPTLFRKLNRVYEWLVSK